MTPTKKILFAFFILVFLVLVGMYFFSVGKEASVPYQGESILPTPPASPLDATYRIEDKEVSLTDGYAEQEIVPGSASIAKTKVYGDLLHGNLSDESDEEVALILTHDEGGSGTFYYVAVAVPYRGGYIGTNAILLGDRIAPGDFFIENHVLTVQYLQHAGTQVMSEEPRNVVTRYFVLSGAFVREVGPLTASEELMSGEFVYGHESHTFTPCGGEAQWISPDSRARAALETIYIERTRDEEPYTPVFVVLGGHTVPALADGFGADYASAVDVERVVTVPKDGSCTAPEALTSPMEDIQ